MAEKQYTLKEIEEAKEIAEALGITYKNTPASTTLTAPTLHGPFPGNANQFGLFSQPGVRPGRFSTLARPDSLVGILGVDRSEYTEEILEVMTGVTAASGTNADGFCGDPPTVGQGKVCEQIYRYGSYYVKTDLNSIPEIGQLRNRADVPAEILNAGPTGNPLIPDLMYQMRDTRSQLQYELWRLGVEFERTLDVVLIQGARATAGANREFGYITEFDGLDQQIKTGYTDAITGLACSAMDSHIITHGANVNTVDGNGNNIVMNVADMMYGLKNRARKFGMVGVNWVILMREELFRSFVENYSCQYDLFRCTGSQYAENNTDQATTNRLRLEMLQGRYLLVDGDRVPVVFSEGIPQTTPAANTMESDMYFIPVSWAGMNLTRLEYFPMDNQYATEFANFVGDDITTMNNGMWIAGFRSTGLCKEYHFANKFRLISETPFLAGRIDNLQYSNFAPIRNALPDGSYYADGGSTYRS